MLAMFDIRRTDSWHGRWNAVAVSEPEALGDRWKRAQEPTAQDKGGN